MNWLGEKVARQVIRKDDFVLDVGCGPGVTTIYGLSGPRPKAIPVIQRGQRTEAPGRFYLGIDVFRPQLDVVKDVFPVMCGSAPECLEPFLDDSWDVVLLLDLVEHLEKDKAVATIEEAKRVSRRDVVIFTPIGFLEQEPHDWLSTGMNEAQRHVCGFEVEELEKLGFRCEKIRNSPIADQNSVYATLQ